MAVFLKVFTSLPKPSPPAPWQSHHSVWLWLPACLPLVLQSTVSFYNTKQCCGFVDADLTGIFIFFFCIYNPFNYNFSVSEILPSVLVLTNMAWFKWQQFYWNTSLVYFVLVCALPWRASLNVLGLNHERNVLISYCLYLTAHPWEWTD